MSLLSVYTKTVSSCLKHKGFRFDRRGDIDVRSTGRITTYFLIRNENATRDQLMGRLPEHQEVHVTGYKPKVNEVTFINEGKQEHPPSTSSSSKGTPPNKVHPATIGKYTCILVDIPYGD